MSGGLSYEALEAGAQLGAYSIVASAQLADEWLTIASLSMQRPNRLPEGAVFVIGLRALMDLEVIPPGGVLAGHDLHFYMDIPTGSNLEICILCKEKSIRKGRPFATLGLNLRVHGELAVEDDMRVLWPSASAASLVGQNMEQPSSQAQSDFPMRVLQSSVERYAALSHDRNPLHLDEAYAVAGPFRGLVVHAVIPAGIMLDAAAGKQPSGSLFGQRANVKFLSPLRPGEAYRLEQPSPGEAPPTWRCRTAAGNLVCIAELFANE